MKLVKLIELIELHDLTLPVEVSSDRKLLKDIGVKLAGKWVPLRLRVFEHSVTFMLGEQYWLLKLHRRASRSARPRKPPSR